MKQLCFLILLGALISACSPSPSPAPTPTLEPVLPMLPTATSAAQATPVPPTPIPLGQATPVPPATDSNANASCQPFTGLAGLRYGVNSASSLQALELAQQLQASWVRLEVRWRDLDRQNGQAYQWEQLDPLLDAAQQRNLRVLLAVSEAPSWATSQAEGSLPDQPETFATFMGALAKHAAGRVAAYEIWPNVNVAAATGGVLATPEQYASLLSAAYPAIKQADPCALVLFGALQPTPPGLSDRTDDLSFYRRVVAANDGSTRNAYDLLAVQLNTGGVDDKGHWPRENQALSRQFYGHLDLIRNEMTAADQADKQVWIVRIGYNITGEHAVDAKKQADYLANFVRITPERWPWVSAVFVRDLLLPTGDADFGLTDANATPRPVFNAVRELFAKGAQTEQLAIEGTDQVLLWRFAPNPYPRGPLYVGRDGAIYTSSGGYVSVLAPNGALRAQVKPGRKYVAGVVADANGRIYASGDNNSLSAYGRGGRLLWSIETDGTAVAAPQISPDGSTLYVSSSTKRVNAYATRDGKQLWSNKLNAALGALTVGPDGTIYVGTGDGQLYALNPTDGSVRWQVATNGGVQSAPILRGERLYSHTATGEVLALQRDGTLLWRSQLGSAVNGIAVADDGTVYASGADNVLYALADGGSQRWATPMPGAGLHAPALGHDGQIFVASGDGQLSVVAASGEIRGSLGLRGPIAAAPAIGNDGAVYVAIGDKRSALVAFGTQILKQRYNTL